MLISVEDFDGNFVFEGEADDFLFKNDNDYDLETILDELECKKFGDTVRVSNDYNNYIITKIDELIY